MLMVNRLGTLLKEADIESAVVEPHPAGVEKSLQRKPAHGKIPSERFRIRVLRLYINRFILDVVIVKPA